MAKPVDITVEWAGGEHVFALKAKQIEELEAVTDAGIGALWRRMVAGDWKMAELRHVVRLGLVGGGMGKVEAERMCKLHFDDVPVMGSIMMPTPDSPLSLAQAIMVALLQGFEKKDDDQPEKQEAPEDGETSGN